MDCLPTVSHIKANIEEQLNFIKEMKPTVIIHLKVLLLFIYTEYELFN